VTESGIWVNGGYFVLRQEIFDYLGRGDDLVTGAFRRLIAERKLQAHRHEGFWAPMDTLKERQELDAAHTAGDAPWELWRDKILEPGAS
jgi:glucose-1-phosphate cytidylyltransferase